MADDKTWRIWYRCYENGELTEDSYDDETASTLEQAITQFSKDKSDIGCECVVWKVEIPE